ncbi:MAG TPA: thioesterase domain-containing protein [Thermoanaerobaculia bacterium]|nr:thioesterase domain-containing protein [Thermoanaerobaculia bacterium]
MSAHLGVHSHGANPWIAYRRARPNARLRLFCFPYAGGGASAYRGWGEELPETVEVCPVQPPGREGRIRQSPLSDLDELLAALDAGLSAELDELPHAFFGHSLGAIVAFELARRRRARGAAPPVHLLVSAHAAPAIPPDDEPLHDLPSDRFRERLRGLNGTPAEVLDHPELMELVEPLLRADFRLNETYRYLPGAPLDCPLTAFCGFRDHEVPRPKMEPWADVTTGRFRLHMLPGDHFFLNGTGRPHLLRLVKDALEWQMAGDAPLRESAPPLRAAGA